MYKSCSTGFEWKWITQPTGRKVETSEPAGLQRKASECPRDEQSSHKRIPRKHVYPTDEMLVTEPTRLLPLTSQDEHNAEKGHF